MGQCDKNSRGLRTSECTRVLVAGESRNREPERDLHLSPGIGLPIRASEAKFLELCAEKTGWSQQEFSLPWWHLF